MNLPNSWLNVFGSGGDSKSVETEQQNVVNFDNNENSCEYGDNDEMLEDKRSSSGTEKEVEITSCYRYAYCPITSQLKVRVKAVRRLDVDRGRNISFKTILTRPNKDSTDLVATKMSTKRKGVDMNDIIQKISASESKKIMESAEDKLEGVMDQMYVYGIDDEVLNEATEMFSSSFKTITSQHSGNADDLSDRFYYIKDYELYVYYPHLPLEGYYWGFVYHLEDYGKNYILFTNYNNYSRKLDRPEMVKSSRKYFENVVIKNVQNNSRLNSIAKFDPKNNPSFVSKDVCAILKGKDLTNVKELKWAIARFCSDRGSITNPELRHIRMNVGDSEYNAITRNVYIDTVVTYGGWKDDSKFTAVVGKDQWGDNEWKNKNKVPDVLSERELLAYFHKEYENDLFIERKKYNKAIDEKMETYAKKATLYEITEYPMVYPVSVEKVNEVAEMADWDLKHFQNKVKGHEEDEESLRWVAVKGTDMYLWKPKGIDGAYHGYIFDLGAHLYVIFTCFKGLETKIDREIIEAEQKFFKEFVSARTDQAQTKLDVIKDRNHMSNVCQEMVSQRTGTHFDGDEDLWPSFITLCAGQIGDMN